MTDNVHILVVDDEAEMRDAVSEYLNLRGFEVSTAANGEEMRRVMKESKIDLVLLDLGLPGEDGIALTRELRASVPVGIIIITAYGEAEDRVLGLESGADDYVVKPFSLRELLARVRSVLRRAEAAGGPASGDKRPDVFRLGENSYDRGTRQLRRADGTTIELSSGECDLLELFVDNPDRPLSRDELLDKTAHRDWEPFDRSIDVRITRLRRKIEADPAHPQLIRTVRGVGYLYKSGV
jgi:two-component system phosphate regulon response regulator OmpR